MHLRYRLQSAAHVGVFAFAFAATEAPARLALLFVMFTAVILIVVSSVDRCTERCIGRESGIAWPEWSSRMLDGISLILLVPAFVTQSVAGDMGALALAVLVPRMARMARRGDGSSSGSGGSGADDGVIDHRLAGLCAAMGVVAARAVADNAAAHVIALTIVCCVIICDALVYSTVRDREPRDSAYAVLALAANALAVAGATVDPAIPIEAAAIGVALAGPLVHFVLPRLFDVAEHPCRLSGLAIAASLVANVAGQPALGGSVVAVLLALVVATVPVPAPALRHSKSSAAYSPFAIVFVRAVCAAVFAAGAVLAARELGGALYLLPVLLVHLRTDAV